MFNKTIIPLPQDVFRLIRDFINNYCGLYFNDNSKYMIERRLNRRLAVHHLKDFREYYRYLMYDAKRDEELQTIIDILTVNETYFFREHNQLMAFSEEIMQELRKNKDKRKVNIWSAGCSTGEEPYTVAMLMLENKDFYNLDINIFASDISRRVLKVAREGIYRQNSFRATEQYLIKKYFQEHGKGTWQISDKVKKLVSFNYLNLLDTFRIKLVGKMDIIFCRNVLIYFDKATRKKVIENFYDILAEGGYLLLGHTESLINISTAFTLKHLKNDMVYQKPLKSSGNLLSKKVLKNGEEQRIKRNQGTGN